MFRSHSLIVLPVLMLPLYGVATAPPHAPQNAETQTAQTYSVAVADPSPAVQKTIEPRAAIHGIAAPAAAPQSTQDTPDRNEDFSGH